MRTLLTVLWLIAFCRSYGQRSPFSGNSTIPLISGDTLPLRYYTGKKVMIVILPASSSAEDSAYRSEIDSICQGFYGRLSVIGVLSYEDGFGDGLLATLRTPGVLPSRNNLVITAGLFTHRTSGLRQSPLFDWLTDPQQNGHFGGDVAGPRHIFLLDEQGRLYRVLAPMAGLSVARLEKLL